MPATCLPAFTEAVLKTWIEAKANYATFRDYIDAEGAATIQKILHDYKQIPTFDEDKNYYYDWGSDELFSVANKGPAECSTGLFDMIEVDQNIIRNNLVLVESEPERRKQNALLYDVLYSAARMLLVTRGAEPRTTSEVFQNFIQLFIQEGLVNSSFLPLIQKVQANAAVDLLADKAEITELSNAVIALYEGMDDSLQFKGQATKTTKTPEATVPPTETTDAADRIKDFRGVACPMNFVKTKIELSSLHSGQLLEIWLDDGQPIQNVPGSVRNEGHQILSTTQVDTYWKVLIKKG